MSMMLRSATRIFRSRSTASSVSAVVPAPKVLRNGPVHASANPIRWTNQVLVKPYDLGVDDDGNHIHPFCYNCHYAVDSDKCVCDRWGRTEIGGFTVQHYVDEPRPTVSIMRRLSNVFFGPAAEPAAAVNLPAPAEGVEMVADGATVQRRGQRTHYIPRAEVIEPTNENEVAEEPAVEDEAAEEPAVEFEAGANLEDDEPLAVVDEALERALEAAVRRKQRMLKVRSVSRSNCLFSPS